MLQPTIIVFIACFVSAVNTITCPVGYGQRGFQYSNGIEWYRTCPATEYCFEVVTKDITKVQALIDYPWVIPIFNSSTSRCCPTKNYNNINTIMM